MDLPILLQPGCIRVTFISENKIKFLLFKFLIFNFWSLANTVSLQQYKTMARDIVLLWKMFVHSLWPRDHNSTKQKVKAINIQNVLV